MDKTPEDCLRVSLILVIVACLILAGITGKILLDQIEMKESLNQIQQQLGDFPINESKLST